MCHKRKNLPSLCIALSTNLLILLDLLHWIHSVNLVKFYFTQLWSNFYAVELSFKVNLHVGFSFSVIVFCQTFYFVINFLTMKWISLNSCSVMQGGREFQKETATTLIHRESLRDLAWSFFQGWNFYDINGWFINLF